VAIDSGSATELLQIYLSGGKTPPALERVLRELLEIKADLVEKRQEASRLDAQRASLSRDSERVRENLNVLRRTRGNADLEQQLARKLASLERELGVLSGRLVQLSEATAERETKLRALIRNVNLDATK
jgi:chromosome segregation ATPase